MEKKRIYLLNLLQQSGPRLHGMLTRLTLDENIAEELMQELFVRLIEIKQLDKIQNIEAYACRMAMNLAFDWRRKQRFYKMIPDAQVDNRTPKVDFNLILNEEFTRILNAVQQLSGMTRECFVLHYIEQMDYDQVAQRTQKTGKQVRALCSKGIRQVREILNEQNTPSYKEANHG